MQRRIILQLLEVFAHLESLFAVAHHDIGSDKSVGVSGGWLQVGRLRSAVILAFSLVSSRVVVIASSLIQWAWGSIAWFVLPFG